MSGRYELDTIVRRPPSRIARSIAALAGASVVVWIACTSFGVAEVLALLLAIGFVLGVRALPGSHSRAHLVASAEGLRVDERLLPRSDFDGAVLRHDGERTYVLLRGAHDLEVEVPNNIEADALTRALGLDAASSTVEFALSKAPSAWGYLAMAAMAAFAGTATYLLRSTESRALAVAMGLVAILGYAWLATRVFLRVGADGLVVRSPLRRARFLAHDAIESVRNDGSAIVVAPRSGLGIVLQVPGIPSGEEPEQRAQDERRTDEAIAIVRRVQQARRAHREHRASAESLVAVLARGDRSAREWLDELRRVGEGAAGTFRTMGASRAQLFAVVESTTARARDRLAALVALRTRLGEDEMPRVRVAAERCAEPALRERMIRVADAASDEALERELAEMEVGP